MYYVYYNNISGRLPTTTLLIKLFVPSITAPNAKAKFNFKVVISTTHKILIHKLGVLKRVCYISPKLRDYKAMHCLRVSKLFPKIINLEPPSHPFDPNARVAPHYLIPYVTKVSAVKMLTITTGCIYRMTSHNKLFNVYLL